MEFHVAYPLVDHSRTRILFRTPEGYVGT